MHTDNPNKVNPARRDEHFLRAILMSDRTAYIRLMMSECVSHVIVVNICFFAHGIKQFPFFFLILK